jgi:Ca2+-binding EF-hand superfamily protein
LASRAVRNPSGLRSRSRSGVADLLSLLGPIEDFSRKEEPMHRGKLNRLAIGLAAGGGMLLSSAAFAGGMSADEKFAMMDTNKDGRVSPDEFEVGAKQMFDKMDTNKDGKVTAAEMDAAHAGKAKGMSSADKIKKVDTNGDGTLSADEHAAGAKKMFNRMDADHDGYLTKQELEAGHKAMEK